MKLNNSYAEYYQIHAHTSFMAPTRDPPQVKGWFQTAVTAGNYHEVNPRDKVIVALMVGHPPRDSGPWILVQGLDRCTFILRDLPVKIP